MEKNIPSSYDIFDVKILSILSQESRQTEKLFIFYCSPRVRVWWTAWTPKENNFKMEKIFGWTVFDESAEKRETSGLHFIIVRVFPSSPFLFPFFLCGKRWQAQGPSRHGTDGWRALPPVPRVPNDVVVWPFGGRRNRSGSLRRQLRRSPLKKNNNNQKKKQSVWCGRVFFLFFFFSVYFYLFNFFFVVVTFPGRRPPKALCSGARKRGEKRRAFGRHRTQYLSPNPRISLFPPTNTTATTTTSSSSSLFSFFFFFYFFWYSCAKVEVGRRRFDFFCVPSAQ